MEPEVHYHIDKSPPPFSVLSQINPVLASPSEFFKIIFNVRTSNDTGLSPDRI